jgi:UDP-glucose 4-epimerase
MATIGDPQSFPITADHPRDPLNWYGRTKVLGERAIETMAADAFPAHLFMISNLYGSHEINGHAVSKNTVINFFVDRATAGETLTVYSPGSQARNFIHVKDVARAYVRSAERLVDDLDAGATGLETYELATDEDLSVRTVAELVQAVAREYGVADPEVQIVDNPRGNETLVESFAVDTTRIEADLGWTREHSVEQSIRELLDESA